MTPPTIREALEKLIAKGRVVAASIDLDCDTDDLTAFVKELDQARAALAREPVDDELPDVPRTMKRDDDKKCAICGHTENEFKAAQASQPRVLVDEVVKLGYIKAGENVSGFLGLTINGTKEGDTVRVVVREAN